MQMGSVDHYHHGPVPHFPLSAATLSPRGFVNLGMTAFDGIIGRLNEKRARDDLGSALRVAACALCVCALR